MAATEKTGYIVSPMSEAREVRQDEAKSHRPDDEGVRGGQWGRME